MISNKDLKSYEFNSTIDYYDYIIDSHINGQPQQVKQLYKDMSPKQRQEFILYLTYDSNYKEAGKLHRYISDNC